MENTVQYCDRFPIRMLHIVDCMAFHRNQCHVQIYIVNKCHNQNTIMFRLFYYKIMSRKIIIQQKGIQNLTRQLVFFQPHSLLSFKMVHNVAFHILFSG